MAYVCFDKAVSDVRGRSPLWITCQIDIMQISSFYVRFPWENLLAIWPVAELHSSISTWLLSQMCSQEFQTSKSYVYCIGHRILIYEMLAGYPPFDFKANKTLNKKDRNALMKQILSAKISKPRHSSKKAWSLIQGLLSRDPEKRLGSGGSEEVKNHSFFKGVDWVGLEEKRVTSAYKPKISHSLCVGKLHFYSAKSYCSTSRQAVHNTTKCEILQGHLGHGASCNERQLTLCDTVVQRILRNASRSYQLWTVLVAHPIIPASSPRSRDIPIPLQVCSTAW